MLRFLLQDDLCVCSQANNRACDCGDADFVLSSAAAVERLWSLADKIVDGARNGTTHVAAEALFFLRCNRSSWDEETVAQAREAVQKSLSKKVENLMNEDEAQVFEE